MMKKLETFVQMMNLTLSVEDQISQNFSILQISTTKSFSIEEVTLFQTAFKMSIGIYSQKFILLLQQLLTFCQKSGQVLTSITTIIKIMSLKEVETTDLFKKLTIELYGLVVLLTGQIQQSLLTTMVLLTGNKLVINLKLRDLQKLNNLNKLHNLNSFKHLNKLNKLVQLHLNKLNKLNLR